MKTGSICLSDIPKEAITTAKNGKKYLSVTVFENDEADRYGNHESIQVSRSKEDRDSGVKAIYIGNLKDWNKEDKKPAPSSIAQPAHIDDGDDDLPF